MVSYGSRASAVDFSLTATGIGVITRHPHGGCGIATSTIRSKPPEHATLTERYARIDTVAREIFEAVSCSELVIVESLSFNSKGQLDRLWAGWWMTVGRLVRAGTPVATVSPTSLKLALTGKAAVDKSVLGRHVAKLWPDLEYANDNEADAAGLAHLGAVALGWDVPTLERHKAVKWTEWPEFGPEMTMEAL